MAAPVLARVAAALLTNEDGRKTIGWVLALLLSPLILLVVFLCCFGDGASQHNNAVVSRRTVQRALTDLERHGFLERTHRRRPNGSLTSNLYRVK